MKEQIKELTNRELTRAELEVMQIIWNRGRAFMGEIVDSFAEESRPAYTTISTVVRILEKKGFVGHDTFGKSHCYYPLLSKEEYRGGFIQSVVNNLFDNSPGQLLSFFAKDGSLTVEQYEELRKIAREIVAKDK